MIQPTITVCLPTPVAHPKSNEAPRCLSFGNIHSPQLEPRVQYRVERILSVPHHLVPADAHIRSDYYGGESCDGLVGQCD